MRFARGLVVMASRRVAPSGEHRLHRALPPRESPATLHVFDFDATLVNTPEPEAGRTQWLAVTGRPWPHAGWWGRHESLDPRLNSTPGPALEAYAAAVADASAVVVVLTGRRAHLAAAVLVHAQRHGCDAAHQFLLNDTPLDTLPFKTQTLTRLLTQYACVREVHIYEDRQPHAEAFSALGADFAHTGVAWHVHWVLQSQQPQQPGPNALPPAVTATPVATAGGRRVPRPRLSSGTPFSGAAPDDGADVGPANGVADFDDDAGADAGALQPAAAESRRRSSAAPQQQQQRPLPQYELLHYLRLNVPLPEDLAAAVPPHWRAAKVARDGAWPPAHVTIATSAELKALGVSSSPEARARLWSLVRQARTGPVRVIGLGCAVDPDGSGNACAFAVVDCPPARWLRRQLGLPPADAHITLGFDGSDVHDGVRKGRNALVMQPPALQPGAPGGVGAVLAAALQRRVKKLRQRAAAKASAAQHSGQPQLQ